METTLRSLNMLLWVLIWTSGALVSQAIPYETLFDVRLYADLNRFVAQGLLFLFLMIGCDLILVWINQKQRPHPAL